MKRRSLTAVLALFCVVLTAQVSPKEKQALLDIYLETQGDQWFKPWDVNTPVSEWQGITVEHDRVTGISLMFNNITGQLPASIGDLVHLKTLELSFNKIEGTLPETLGALTHLNVLAFNGNAFTGTIPSSLGNLTNLKQLHLSSNKLSGNVPKEINNLTALEVFNVFDNNLSGTLPVQLANNHNLKELMIAENNFTNTDIFSIVLLSNSAALDLEKKMLVPSAKTVIAIESSDDN
jgi:Leucine-rich repeat (LRR) protein